MKGAARPIGVLDDSEGVVAIFLVGKFGMADNLARSVNPFDLWCSTVCTSAGAKQPARHVDIVYPAVHKYPARRFGIAHKESGRVVGIASGRLQEERLVAGGTRLTMQVIGELRKGAVNCTRNSFSPGLLYLPLMPTGRERHVQRLTKPTMTLSSGWARAASTTGLESSTSIEMGFSSRTC